MAGPALGILAKLGIGAAGGDATLGLDFASESLKAIETHADLAGLRGTRDRIASRVRAVERRVAGTIQLQPTPVELDGILKYIMGGTPTGTTASRTFPFAETLPQCVFEIVRSTKMFKYDNCTIGRAAFRGTPGAAMDLTLDIVGVDEVVSAASGYPALTLDTTTVPFIFSDTSGALTINGVTVDQFSWSLTIDNSAAQRRVNSITPTQTYSTDRIITWQFEPPYGDAEALYNLAVSGVAVSAVFTNGNTSLSMSSPRVAFPREAPNAASRDEMHLPLTGIARYNATPGDSLVLVLDSTP